MNWRRNKSIERRIDLNGITQKQLRRISLLGREIMRKLNADNLLFIEYENTMVLRQEIKGKVAYKKGFNVQQNVQQNFANHGNNISENVNVYKNATELT